MQSSMLIFLHYTFFSCFSFRSRISQEQRKLRFFLKGYNLFAFSANAIWAALFYCEIYRELRTAIKSGKGIAIVERSVLPFCFSRSLRPFWILVGANFADRCVCVDCAETIQIYGRANNNEISCECNQCYNCSVFCSRNGNRFTINDCKHILFIFLNELSY